MDTDENRRVTDQAFSDISTHLGCAAHMDGVPELQSLTPDQINKIAFALARKGFVHSSRVPRSE